jgi:hypothetical protein
VSGWGILARSAEHQKARAGTDVRLGERKGGGGKRLANSGRNGEIGGGIGWTNANANGC